MTRPGKCRRSGTFVYRISESKPLKKERSGLGIKNLEERLNIAYPNAYELTLNNDNPVFHARLKLKLNG